MSHLELREDVVGRIDHFSYAVSTMSNLETLVISVPESLCQGIGTLFNSPFDLACLKTCTGYCSSREIYAPLLTWYRIGSLFYQTPNNTYWDLQTNIHIFAHPTLESLTIRRARLDKRGFDSLEQPNLTPLTTLSFIDCDINDDGLSDLLAIPESLSSFSISQKQFPNPPLKESPDDVDEYFIALRSAEHSLESVRIDFPGLSAEHPLKLRRFEKVTKLDIRDYQLFGQTDGPRLHTVGLPPFLEELRFLNPLEDEDIAELVVYTLENRFTLGFARKLKRIVVAREDHTDFVPSPVWERASSPVWGRSPFSFEEPVKEAGWIPTLRKACVEAEVELVVE